MSGIVGIYQRDGGPVVRQHVERMLGCLSHRGDGVAVWSTGSIGLGSRSSGLQTRPEKAGSLMAYEHLVVDARIDNREELLSRLKRRFPGDAVSDCMLVLAAYQTWGTACPRYLVGSFAFALWDAHRQWLFCARDHLGLTPLYYYASRSRFAVASEIKAFWCLPDAPQRLNEAKVADYLMQMAEDTETTFFQDIRRLPPAHSMIVTHGGLCMECYWALDAERELRLPSNTAYAARYRHHFSEAVRCRLPRVGAVGTMLSGGLDSSSVTCMARSLLQAEGARPARVLHAFSLVFDEVAACDERPYIQAVLRGGGIEAHAVPGDRVSALADLDRMLWHNDEPFFAPTLFLHWAVWGVARACGVRVVLDGYLGDNTVWHGTSYPTELAAKGEWRALARELYALGTGCAHPWQPVGRALRRYVLAPFVLEPLQRAWRTLTGPVVPSTPWRAYVSPDLARRVHLAERMATFGQDVPRMPRAVRAAHHANLSSWRLCWRRPTRRRPRSASASAFLLPTGV